MGQDSQNVNVIPGHGVEILLHFLIVITYAIFHILKGKRTFNNRLKDRNNSL